MTLHDLNMHEFKQYWKRSIRTGYAYAEISSRYSGSEDPLWKEESNHNVTKIISYLILAVMTGITVYEWGSIYLLLFPLILALFIAKTTYTTYRKTNDFPLSLAYGLHSHFQHLPLFLGQLKYWFKRSELSTYKT